MRACRRIRTCKVSDTARRRRRSVRSAPSTCACSLRDQRLAGAFGAGVVLALGPVGVAIGDPDLARAVSTIGLNWSYGLAPSTILPRMIKLGVALICFRRASSSWRWFFALVFLVSRH